MSASEAFINAIHSAVYRTAIDGVLRLLESPPGRRPRPKLVDLSSWFNGLDENGRDQVRDVVRLSVDQALFGILAGIDGSRPLGAADLALLAEPIGLVAVDVPDSL